MVGTHPWEDVALNFTVPPDTDFLTLRCVLIGTGSAWFDETYLGEAEADPPSPPKADAKEPGSAPAAAEPEEELKALRAEIEKLKKAHYVLAEAVEALRRELRARDTEQTGEGTP